MVHNFLFHRVSPQRDPLWDPMSLELFEKCIKFIQSKYELVQFEALAQTEELYNSKAKYATIMFDDGYKDNVDFALPILEAHDVKASFYLITDCIDKNIPSWTHILDYSFQHTESQGIELPFEFLEKGFQAAQFNTLEEKLDFAKRLKPFIKNLPQSDRRKVLSAINSQFSDLELPKLMMNWDDARSLRKLGHYVGSHTVSHDMLATIRNEADIEFELKESAKRIEAELSYFPKTISYPVGSYDDRVLRLSKSVGYQFGLAVNQEIYQPLSHDLFEVPRIELYNESWFKTKMRITHSLERLKKLISYR